MLDHPDPELIFLSYTESSAGTGELSVKKTKSLRERLPRPAEFCNDLLIDPTGKVLLVSSYVGRLKVVVLKNGMYSQDFDVTCVVFIHGVEGRLIYVIWQTPRAQCLLNRVSAYCKRGYVCYRYITHGSPRAPHAGSTRTQHRQLGVGSPSFDLAPTDRPRSEYIPYVYRSYS